MAHCGLHLFGSVCSNTSPIASAFPGPRSFSITPCSSERRRPMLSLPLLEDKDKPDSRPPLTLPSPPVAGGEGRVRERLPSWLKRSLPQGNGNSFTHQLLRELRLETVCENARCPNRPECYARRTATFMILGNVCTRPCGFCSVPRGTPEVLEDDEPARVAEAANRLGLRHVVITSVTRDDLPDGGADHFARCVLAVRQRTGAVVEVLTPDFLGDRAAIDCVLEAAPEVYNHNLETVPRLYKKVRGRAAYQRSLNL